MKLVRKSENGVTFDSYALERFSWDGSCDAIDITLQQTVIDSDYVAHTKTIYAHFHNKDATQEYSVDLNWNENSTPPKPANFDLSQPSTWGDLTITQIPMVENKFDKLEYFIKNVDVMPIEKIILTMCVDQKVITGVTLDGATWNFK